MKKRIALFPGTFDPFTIGHQSLVSRGLALVDEIIISIGINDKKQTYFTLEKRLEAIRCLYKDEPRVKVESEIRCHRTADYFLPHCYLRLDSCHRSRTDHRLRTLHETCHGNY